MAVTGDHSKDTVAGGWSGEARKCTSETADQVEPGKILEATQIEQTTAIGGASKVQHG
jgi:hypothetical protein